MRFRWIGWDAVAAQGEGIELVSLIGWSFWFILVG
jgi:hypothetical protein